MAEKAIKVRARITLRSTEAGGRSKPLPGGCDYRPNHNFFADSDRGMAIGNMRLPEGTELNPGETIEVEVTFLPWTELEAVLYPGREWLIQEGLKVVGEGKVLQVLA